MKILYEFNVDKEIEVDETTETVNEAGATVKTTIKVKKKEPQKFTLRKPNRSLMDEAELFYGVELAKGINAGMLSYKMLEKRFNNDGGFLTEAKRKEKEDITAKFYLVQKELLELPKDNQNEEQKARFNELITEMSGIREKLQEFQMEESEIYEQTAEVRAKNKVMVWWVVHLAYEGDKPYFGAGSFKERLEKCDQLVDDGSDFEKLVTKKFGLFISFWYMGKATDKLEFEILDKSFAK